MKKVLVSLALASAAFMPCVLAVGVAGADPPSQCTASYTDDADWSVSCQNYDWADSSNSAVVGTSGGLITLDLAGVPEDGSPFTCASTSGGGLTGPCAGDSVAQSWVESGFSDFCGTDAGSYYEQTGGAGSQFGSPFWPSGCSDGEVYSQSGGQQLPVAAVVASFGSSLLDEVTSFANGFGLSWGVIIALFVALFVGLAFLFWCLRRVFYFVNGRIGW